MTSNRYVVLNCPTLMGNRLCYSKVIKQCADCTDCLIKRVIDKCKEVYGNTDTSNDDKASLARELLIMFDIQEVEE